MDDVEIKEFSVVVMDKATAARVVCLMSEAACELLLAHHVTDDVCDEGADENLLALYHESLVAVEV